jgi:serine/threonine-protein kinase
MELLQGESLFDRLRREGSLPPPEAVGILWQICAALEAAHARGVVHRDLKPENVFMARSGSGRETAKILDFGIAKLADPTGTVNTASGMVVGTPEYLSPEQATGGEVDARADLYGVGLIAWRMLVGRHPFKAPDARALLMMQATQPVPLASDARTELGAWPGLVAAVARACEKAVARRHQSAASLKADLAAAVPGFTPPSAATPPPTATPSGTARGTWPPPAADAPRTTIDTTVGITPTVQPSWSLQRQIRRARLKLAVVDGWRRGVAMAERALHRTSAAARAQPLPFAAAGAALLALAIVLAVGAWSRGRAASDARAFLRDGRTAEARSVLQTALRRRPDDAELLLLHGRALHSANEPAGGIDAYAAALERTPLDAEALRDLAEDLGRERSVAERAGRLLVRIGPAALPTIEAAAKDGTGIQRLRALTIARDLGIEERLDRTAAYGALLLDADCDVRRAAARRLGELGSADALPKLRELAGARKESHGLFGALMRSPACGAPEAAEAIHRIEAPPPR